MLVQWSKLYVNATDYPIFDSERSGGVPNSGFNAGPLCFCILLKVGCSQNKEKSVGEGGGNRTVTHIADATLLSLFHSPRVLERDVA